MTAEKLQTQMSAFLSDASIVMDVTDMQLPLGDLLYLTGVTAP